MSEPNQSSIEIDLDSYKDLTVGEILKRTREHYGQSIGHVEVNLRIRSSYIRAIENNIISDLPGRVYAIGFVRAYSEYLGLDGDKMVYLFKAQLIGKNNRPELQFPASYEDSKTPNIFFVLGGIFVAAICMIYLSVTYESPNYREPIPTVPPQLKKSTLTVPEPTSIEDIIAGDQRNRKGFELVVTQDSWVEIRDQNGNQLISEVLKPGDKYIIPDDERLIMTTGNAGGLTVFIDGEEIQTLGEPAQVRRDIDLSRQNFER
ncbi:MAG: RodZ domain-containing protein [Pseudomonadota bacterium]